MIGKLQDAFAVITPSIAFENYPNIGLEAIACNCLVCGTDNGGIPEMAASEKLLFRHDRQCQDRKFVLKLSNKRVSKMLKSVRISRTMKRMIGQTATSARDFDTLIAYQIKNVAGCCGYNNFQIKIYAIMKEASRWSS